MGGEALGQATHHHHPWQPLLARESQGLGGQIHQGLTTRLESQSPLLLKTNLGQAENAAAPKLQAAPHLQTIHQHQRSLLAPDRPKSRSLGICINMSTYILKTLRQFLPIVVFPNFDLSWFPFFLLYKTCVMFAVTSNNIKLIPFETF